MINSNLVIQKGDSRFSGLTFKAAEGTLDKLKSIAESFKGAIFKWEIKVSESLQK